ncbi:MAG: hypothetical protein HZB38_09180, partial [Planctomycetes bacterium]|nr:hypothetical protein [Planctomycetota bacterium]
MENKESTVATAAGTTNKAPAHAPPHVHEVTFIGYPKLMFIWPLIAIGLLLWPFGPPSAEHSAQLEVLGWVYITVLGLVLLTMGVDVNRNQAVFWIVLIFALWILGAYLNAVRNIPLFGWIFNWFGALNVQYDRSFGLAISAILGIPFVILFIYARLNDRWRIT